LLTGNVGRPGAGIYPVRSGANSQGLKDMGVRPDGLPADAGKLEAAWGTDLASIPAGVGVADLVPAIEAGTIKAVYVIGADPALAFAGDERTKAALGKLECLVVQDSFPTDTAALAEVVLASAVAFEDEGTFTNGERFVQRVRAAAPLPGSSHQDWAIVQELANALGADWVYAGPADVMREISELYPEYRGISYAKIDDATVQVPCSTDDCCGTPVLLADAPQKFTFVPAPAAEPVAGGDFTLLTGSVKEHHGTGVRTRRSAGSTSLVPEARLEINPSDAVSLGVTDGDKVRAIAAAGGAVEVEAAVTDRVPAGCVFLPSFSAIAPVARLLKGAGHPKVTIKKV